MDGPSGESRFRVRPGAVRGIESPSVPGRTIFRENFLDLAGRGSPFEECGHLEFFWSESQLEEAVRFPEAPALNFVSRSWYSFIPGGSSGSGTSPRGTRSVPSSSEKTPFSGRSRPFLDQCSWFGTGEEPQNEGATVRRPCEGGGCFFWGEEYHRRAALALVHLQRYGRFSSRNSAGFSSPEAVRGPSGPRKAAPGEFEEELPASRMSSGSRMVAPDGLPGRISPRGTLSPGRGLRVRRSLLTERVFPDGFAGGRGPCPGGRMRSPEAFLQSAGAHPSRNRSILERVFPVRACEQFVERLPYVRFLVEPRQFRVSKPTDLGPFSPGGGISRRKVSGFVGLGPGRYPEVHFRQPQQGPLPAALADSAASSAWSRYLHFAPGDGDGGAGRVYLAVANSRRVWTRLSSPGRANPSGSLTPAPGGLSGRSLKVCPVPGHPCGRSGSKKRYAVPGFAGSGARAADSSSWSSETLPADGYCE